MEWKQKQFKQANLVQLEPNKLLKNTVCVRFRVSDLYFNKKLVSPLFVHVKQYRVKTEGRTIPTN